MAYVSVPDFILTQTVETPELDLLRENIRFMTEVFFQIAPSNVGYALKMVMDKDVTNGGKIEFDDASKFIILNKTTPRQLDFNNLNMSVEPPNYFLGNRSWVSFGVNLSAVMPLNGWGDTLDGSLSPESDIDIESLRWCARVGVFTTAGNFRISIRKNNADAQLGANVAVAAIGNFSGSVIPGSAIQVLTSDTFNAQAQLVGGNFQINFAGIFEVVHRR